MPSEQIPTTQPICLPVAPNIYQVRLPLPFALNHVNCYLLRDNPEPSHELGLGQWTMLDTGLNRPESLAAWATAFVELGITPQHIQRIIVTHTHPDHLGLAGYWQAATGAPVYLSALERDLIPNLWRANAWEPTAIADFIHAAGISQEILTVMAAQTENLRGMTLPHPTAMVALTAGETIEMAGRTFHVLQAAGHSDGQLLFYSPADQLLLCADHVLGKISPNIGFWPATAPDPLGRYLASLRQLTEIEVQLALPGHGRLITDWRGRLAELQAHHAQRLQKMLDAVAVDGSTGSTAFDVTLRVFELSRYTDHEVRFAVAETLAHLEYLAERGQLQRVEEGSGRRYRL